MTEAYCILLQLLGKALFQKTPAAFPEIDWAAVHEEAQMQAVAPLTLDAADALGIMPKAVKEQWFPNALTCIVKQERLLAEQRKVITILEQNQIPCVILKGSSSAMWYPNPGLRVMGDIDLLVEPAHQQKAVEILQENGYGEVWEKEHHCHFTLAKGDVVVEVHREPNGFFINKDSHIADRLNTFFADALQRRQILSNLPILADDQQAVVLIIHKLEHFVSGGLGLRQLCDWAVFVDKRLTPERWSCLEPILADCGLLYFTGIITRVCVDYLGLPPEKAPWAAGSDKVLAGEVMEQIFACGNFGRKNSEYGQRYFTDVHSSNRITSFIRVVISASKQHWPICKKYPILVPIAPFVAYGKYLRLRKEGKRSALQPIKLYQSSKAKQQLYRELKPFVKE